jgi:hypothetical protein
MGSSRRFGVTSELKLQKILRQTYTNIDASQMTPPILTDRSTRFDYEAKDAQIREDIDKKRQVCFY